MKAYKAYTPNWYHVLVWVLYPLAAVACCYLMQAGILGRAYTFYIPEAILGVALCVVEVFFDAFSFGGICSKEYTFREYFKISKRGAGLFKQILTLDIMRRILLFISIFLANLAIGLALGQEIGWGDLAETCGYLLWNYLLCSMVIFITRYTNQLILCMCGAYFCMVFGALLQTVIVVWIPVPAAVMILVELVGAIVFSILTVQAPMKKMEGSFYDTQRS